VVEWERSRTGYGEFEDVNDGGGSVSLEFPTRSQDSVLK
jgi:hypothetical protein